MRAATSIRLLLVPAVLLAAGCDDASLPQEPTALEAEHPVAEGVPSPLTGPARWADGYLLQGSPLRDSSDLSAGGFSYNRGGGAIIVTKPAGTTGRYIATFRGLSAVLGTRSAVHVTHYGIGTDSYCKPVIPRLVTDRVEVRCFKAGTRAPANASFTVLVSGKYADRAFAYAHQPTSTDYSPASAGSWNPAGASRIFRDGTGQYRVVFSGLGALLPPGGGGHVQVNAAGTGKTHCKAQEFGGSPNLTIQVRCYSPAGGLTDSKFTAFIALPAAHLAYAWGDRPTALSYSPFPAYTSTPSGGTVYITRAGPGDYKVEWTGVDAEIIESGTVQVTAYGRGNAQCKAYDVGDEFAIVRCFGPNGLPVDSYYMVLLGS
jgi:hypothetical protein